jgi:hypothetical protein
LSTRDGDLLNLANPAPLARNPAAVYIAGLASPHCRRNMLRYLGQIADVLHYGLDQDDPERGLRVNWRALRFQHTAAIRAQLLDRYTPATVNGMLSALRGVLKAARELGYMSAEDYQRAAAVKKVKGETLPAGRDLKQARFCRWQICASPIRVRLG